MISHNHCVRIRCATRREIRGGADQGLGTADDRNVELVLPAPFELASVGGSTGQGAGADDTTDDRGDLAATGGGAAGLAALALGGAIALRARGARGTCGTRDDQPKISQNA